MHTWSGLACLHRQVPWLAEESHGSHHFSLPPPCSLASWDGRVRQGWALVCLTLGVSFPSPPFCPPHCHQDPPPPRPPALSSSPAGPCSRCPWPSGGAICLWGSSLSCPCGSPSWLPAISYPVSLSVSPRPRPVTSSPPHRLPYSTFLSSQQPPVPSVPQPGAQRQRGLSADLALRSPSVCRQP